MNKNFFVQLFLSLFNLYFLGNKQAFNQEGFNYRTNKET